MQKSDPLIHTKLRLPSTRASLVLRPRLQEQIARGLCSPLTLVVAPAGFGKTTLVATCVSSWSMSVAWLSLDKDDNDLGRFLKYLFAALHEVNNTIGSDATQLMASSLQAPPQVVLTSLINDLDSASGEVALVLDDYQFISNQAVHEQVAFLLERCPKTLHLVIVTRSDPPLPLARLRGRSQMVELRAADLRFTESEAAQFLNAVMDLSLDAGSVTILEERTEGWIAGLQMAALSMRDREDIPGFVKKFSGTNRYILDYLLEEVLVSQSTEIQRFLLYTSILDRLTASLCDAILKDEAGEPSSILLEYLEQGNLFLVSLDDERQWYRYHHLFADLLRARLDQIYPGLAPQLHTRAAVWHEQNGAIVDAIHHASMIPDDELVERLINQNYLEMMNRGEMSWVRFWTGNLSRELVHRRPWLCLYEAMNRSWFGQLEEANLLLNEAEKRIRSDASEPDSRIMLAYHAYVKSRVTAMQGDTRRAIECCLAARENIPMNNLDFQIDFSITLGYEYFLCGDFGNANKILNETIQLGYIARAINNPIAAYCLLARSELYQGRLHQADAALQKAVQLLHEPGGDYLGVVGLIEVETAALLCEWNKVDEALVRLKKGLDYLPWWGKTDDFCLAYITLSRIYLAQGNQTEATEAIEKASQLIQTRGVFSEARRMVETAQIKLWLLKGNWPAIDRWSAEPEKRFGSQDHFQYEDELTDITQARVLITQNKLHDAIRLLFALEEFVQSDGSTGRLIPIMILKALALQALGDTAQAVIALTKSLALAEPGGYIRIFLDEHQPMRLLLAQGLAHIDSKLLRDYAIRLLSEFDAEPLITLASQAKISRTSDLLEPLSQREIEVLRLMALGKTNQEIALQLIVASGTIKAHTSSIYRKLNVANRTEAVARARLLGMLP